VATNLLLQVGSVWSTQVDRDAFLPRAPWLRLKHDPQLCLYHLPLKPLQRVCIAEPFGATRVKVGSIGRIGFNANCTVPTALRRKTQKEGLDRLDSIGRIRRKFMQLLQSVEGESASGHRLNTVLDVQDLARKALGYSGSDSLSTPCDDIECSALWIIRNGALMHEPPRLPPRFGAYEF